MIKITLPDGSIKEVKKGTTPMQIALSIGERLARNSLAAKVNNKLWDMNRTLNKDCYLQILTFNDQEGKQVFWHSTNHILAQAVKEIYPEAKLGIGPAIDEGFYYDFDIDKSFSPEDLELIEKKMQEIIDKNLETKRIELNKKEAMKMFSHEHYRIELLEDMQEINEHGENNITAYEQGDFTDLCRGPHIPKLGVVKAFKLTKVAGAYWKGDQKNKQLQRIYGISFPDKKMLRDYLEKIEEAKKRDHRVIGKNLDLFSFNELSPGAPFFHPKGTIIFNELQKFLREEYFKRSYSEVITPLIYDKILWETSGHWKHYKDNMFLVKMDEKESSVKPMNCPGHCLLFKNSTKSYRDLPLRISDFSALHRNEVKGALGGLTRVRKFQQDDTHIFCSQNQIQEELQRVINFIKFIYEDVFNFEYHVELSTRPADSLGAEEQWNIAEAGLKTALEKAKISYTINLGDGAFYGPKIDVHIKDSLGRSWQLATMQLDFQLPQRFELTYEGSDGKKHTPIMIHQASLGSLERFIGVLIEHFAGKFPLWLSPVQVIVMTLSDKYNDYGQKVVDALKDKGIRAELDSRVESMNYKVREAQLQKIPLMLTVGEKEEQAGAVSIRTLDGKIKFAVKLEEFADKTSENIKNRKLNVDFV